MERSLGGDPAGPLPNAPCRASGSPPPGLPMCLLGAEHADVSIDCNRMEVDCKTEQQVSGHPVGMRLNGPSQHACSQHHPGKGSSQEQGGYLLRVHLAGTGTVTGLGCRRHGEQSLRPGRPHQGAEVFILRNDVPPSSRLPCR